MTVYADELASEGYRGDESQFRDILIETLAELFPGRSADDVLDHPDDGDAYCDAVQFKTSNWQLSDYLILSMLVDCRKKGMLPNVGHHRRPPLYKQLTECSCGIQVEEFLDFLQQVLEDGYSPPFSDESIRYRPRVARGYCRKVKDLLGCLRLPDDLILRSLNNLRKSGSRQAS